MIKTTLIGIILLILGQQSLSTAVLGLRPHIQTTAAASADETTAAVRVLSSLLQRHDAGSLLTTRPKWPRNVPVSIELTPYPLDVGSRGRYLIEFSDCNHRVFASAMMPHPIRPTERSSTYDGGSFAIPSECITDDGEGRIVVRVRHPHADDDSAYGEITFSIDLEESTDEILVPLADVDLMNHLKRQLAIGVRDKTVRDEGATLQLWIPANLPEDVAIALRLDLHSDDELIGTARFATSRFYRQLQELRLGRGQERHMVPVETDMSLKELIDRSQGRRLLARVSPDPEYALRDFDNDRYLHWDEPFMVEVDTSALEQ